MYDAPEEFYLPVLISHIWDFKIPFNINLRKKNTTPTKESCHYSTTRILFNKSINIGVKNLPLDFSADV